MAQRSQSQRFLAARGIIPGKEGRFISDSTEPYTVNIPVRLRRNRHPPETGSRRHTEKFHSRRLPASLNRRAAAGRRLQQPWDGSGKESPRIPETGLPLKKDIICSTECRTVLCPANRDNPFASLLFAIHPENENRHSFVQHRLFLRKTSFCIDSA